MAVSEKCTGCCNEFSSAELDDNFRVCPSCGMHMRLSAKNRIKVTLDDGSFKEYFADIESADPLNFPGYRDKLYAAKIASGLSEAVICGTGSIKGQKAVICIMDGNFMMASMGSAVGERITASVEMATKRKLPLIIFTVSGGARMQEGVFSLMQMAKVSGAIMKHNSKGLLYISVITDPTTGGITASFAMQGDIIISEPGALVGFAGRRVIEGTIKQELPKEFQRAEFLLEKGFIDIIVHRHDIPSVLYKILNMHSGGGRK